MTAGETPYRLMVVCHGNICRSPMAAIVLRSRFDEAGWAEAGLAEAGLAEAGWADRVEVESSGLSDEERGNPVDPRAAKVLERHGYRVGRHRARRIDPARMGDHDLVLGMDARQVRRLRALARDDGVERVRLYREFDSRVPAGTPETELAIADPWYGGPDGFEDTLTLIEHGAEGIVEHVRRRIVA